jgi:hypothetical protein
VSTFELCPRKWSWRKLDGIEDPGNRFSSFGKVTHAHLEAWFVSRTLPPETPEGIAARAILAHLPPPQTPGIEVEQEIRTMLGGVPFLGYIDLRIIEGRDVPFVSDHKTTSGLQWAKSPLDLVNDVAATLYAYDTMCSANVEAVDLQWTYATSKGKPKTLPVCRRVTLDEIKPRLDKTAESAAAMRLIFDAKPPAIEVPYDAGGCEAFGGCPYLADHCKLSPQERIRSVMTQGEQHSAFLTKLRNKRGGNAAPAPHPAPAEPTPATPAEPVPTTAGTVNPPETPATAEASPPPEPAPKPKGRRKRRTKAEIAADKAAKKAAADGAEVAAAGIDTSALDAAVAKTQAAAPTAPPTASPAPEVPKPAQPVAGAVAAPVAPVAGDLLGLLNKQYAEGFKAGVAMALGMGLGKP